MSSSLHRVHRIAISRAVSQAGSMAAFVAITAALWQQTHSALWQGAGLVVTWGLAGVLGAVAGPLGDRFDRRRVMIVAESGAGVAFLCLAAHTTPAWIIALALVATIANAPFNAACTASIPQLVDDSQLDRANAAIVIATSVGFLLGPVIGGVVMAAAGASAVFALNGVSFLASALLVSSVRGRFQAERSAFVEVTTPRVAWTEGMRLIARSPTLTRVTVAWSLTSLGLFGASVVLAPLAETLGTSNFGYGILVAGWGLGMILGSLAGTRLTDVTEPRGLLVGMAAIAAACLVLLLNPTLALAQAAIVLAGIGAGLASVADTSIFQRHTPDQVRARAVSAYLAAVSTADLTSYLLAGLVLAVATPSRFFALGLVLATAGCLVIAPMARNALTAGTAPNHRTNNLRSSHGPRPNHVDR